MRKVKKHIGLIIILMIVIAFPTSLSNQIKINLRVIVTGIAVDKSGDEFEVTAQVMKPTAGSKTSGSNAEIDYISDKGKTLAGAISKLSFKAGKASAFSHTNFVILGNDMLEEDLTVCLDYFIRDKIIKNSALILIAEEKASDEIKKTKNTDLSVAMGLQKVFIFKEHESDGLMTTMMQFLNDNRSKSETATVSMLSLKSNEESSGTGLSNSSGGSSSGGSSGESDSESGSGGGSGGGGSSSAGSSGSSGGENQNQYFVADAPILIFKKGKYVGRFEGEDEVSGFMLTHKNAKAIDLMVESTDDGRLKDAKIEINIKNMGSSKSVTFENGKPKLNIKIKIYNAEINEVLCEDIISFLSDEEYENMKKDISKEIEGRVQKCFEKATILNADIFDAFETAYRRHYGDAKKYQNVEEFLNDLTMNVEVDIRKLDH